MRYGRLSRDSDRSHCRILIKSAICPFSFKVNIAEEGRVGRVHQRISKYNPWTSFMDSPLGLANFFNPASPTGSQAPANGPPPKKGDASPPARAQEGRSRQLKVKEFKLDWIPSNAHILITGRRATGKSHLCTQLLTHKAKALPIVFASKYVAGHYRKYLPAENVLENFNENLVQNLLNRQSQQHSTDIIFAFDDVTHDGVCLMDNPTVRDIVKYGSSLNITSIFNVQHAGVYDETFRRNVDFVFIFHDNLVDDQRILYEKYGNMFASFEDFQVAYKQCTTEEPYRCLVLNMREPWPLMDEEERRRSRKAPDGVYWYSSTRDLPASSDSVPRVSTEAKPAATEPRPSADPGSSASTHSNAKRKWFRPKLD